MQSKMHMKRKSSYEEMGYILPEAKTKYPYWKTEEDKKMRKYLAVAAFLTATYNPSALAHHISEFNECKAYRVTEEYSKGYIDEYGDYRRGNINTQRHRIGCMPMGHMAHAYHHPHAYPTHYPHTAYPHAPTGAAPSAPGAPVVVQQNQAAASAPTNSCGKVGRMSAGALVGGITGYYAGGGKKSSKTLLNTAIGSGIGAVLGRITC